MYLTKSKKNLLNKHIHIEIIILFTANSHYIVVDLFRNIVGMRFNRTRYITRFSLQ